MAEKRGTTRGRWTTRLGGGLRCSAWLVAVLATTTPMPSRLTKSSPAAFHQGVCTAFLGAKTGHYATTDNTAKIRILDVSPSFHNGNREPFAEIVSPKYKWRINKSLDDQIRANEHTSSARRDTRA
jgi:hypothetical protein